MEGQVALGPQVSTAQRFPTRLRDTVGWSCGPKTSVTCESRKQVYAHLKQHPSVELDEHTISPKLHDHFKSAILSTQTLPNIMNQNIRNPSKK